ncbi:MAG: LytTR family DNA-binding domain-containing protein [bacterium]
MRILIVEDEPPIADYIEIKVRTILGSKIKEVFLIHTFDEAQKIIKNKKIDLCFLDLNLKGKDGYELLEQTSLYPFSTIIISAHPEQAIKAFEFGVIDFIPKPFDLNRLRTAIDRYFGSSNNRRETKYLVYRKNNRNLLLDISDVIYFKSDGYVVIARMKDNSNNLLEKSLKHLEKILPENFLRIHRSYILNLSLLEFYGNKGGGSYIVRLKNKEALPLSRSGLKSLNLHVKKK